MIRQIRQVFVALFIVLGLATSAMSQEVKGYIDRVDLKVARSGDLSIQAQGWAFVSENTTPLVSVASSGWYKGENTTLWSYVYPTFARIDANRSLGIPDATRTGWVAETPCESGQAYWVQVAVTDWWLNSYKYAICRNDDPTLTASIVDGAGKPLGENTPQNDFVSVRLVKMEEYGSYQPNNQIQNYQTGNGIVVDGVLKIWEPLEHGKYTILFDGWTTDLAHQTFDYNGGPINLGKFVLRKMSVDVTIETEYILTGEKQCSPPFF